MKKKILITGGAGFIGSHVVRRFVNKYEDYHIYNIDSLTYAGNLENLIDIEKNDNYTFIKGDIKDEVFINKIFDQYKFEHVIHLAAESHVDRSISDPLLFAKTNILGTMVLLNAFKNLWQGNWNDRLFYHVSTDEVYGSLGDSGLFTESTAYDPNSPYSASKASSDHFVRAYGETYDMPYVITNCSNNYGAFQFPEKLIPKLIYNILNNKFLPIYGKGINSREWIHVIDHCDALLKIFKKGKIGESYNVGSNKNIKNIDIAKKLIRLSKKQSVYIGKNVKIKFVKDRPGHDLRYALNSNKIKSKLNWKSKYKFEDGIMKTFTWYLNNQEYFKNFSKKDITKRLGN